MDFEWEKEYRDFRGEVRSFIEEWRTPELLEENDLYFFTLRGKDRSLAWVSAEECLEEASAAVDAPREWIC